jgi:alkylation response protein AidB-like acyl-CoA dehydrogenase
MNFSLEYTTEQEQFAQEVRSWLDANVPEGITPIRDTLKMSPDQWERRREFVRRLGSKGWLYPGYPEEYGGGGLDADHRFVLVEELAARGFTLPPLYDTGILCAPAILACGAEEQKRRLLPPILRGELLTWQLFTEPEAGTDEANQRTNALRSERKGGCFIVNGHKIFVGSFPSKPEQLYLLTRSDLAAPRHRNLSSFVIPANLPGITVQPLDLFPLGAFPSVCGPTGGAVPAVKHSVFFDDVEIHESFLIGKEGEGWKVTTSTLDVEHGGSLGGGIQRNYMAERFLTHCRENPRIAKRIEQSPYLLDSIAEIHIGAQIERLLSTRNAAGLGGRYGGPQLSVHSKMFGTRFIVHAARVLGPYAFVDDPVWGVEDGFFEVGERAGVCLAPGGTPEALKIGIARALAVGR